MLDSLLKEYKSLLIGRWQTDLANTAAFLFSEMKDINWVGFYLLEKETLWLGPFQGKPACTEIKMGKGVCGTAAKDKITVIVPDVHLFPGHITCDPTSRSEIVVPLLRGSELLGVLDVDSASFSRFSSEDAKFLESLVQILLA